MSLDQEKSPIEKGVCDKFVVEEANDAETKKDKMDEAEFILNEELRLANNRANEAEENMLKAAEMGQNLLRELNEVKRQIDSLEQEKHELSLRLDSKTGTITAMEEELEHLKDKASQLEVQHEERKVLEKELSSLKSKLSSRDLRESQYEEQIRLLESQLQATNEVIMNASAINDNTDNNSEKDQLNIANRTYSQEFLELQSEQERLLHEKQKLQHELLEYQEVIHANEESIMESNTLKQELTLKLEDKEKELNSYRENLLQLREDYQLLELEVNQAGISRYQSIQIQTDDLIKKHKMLERIIILLESCKIL